MRANVTAPGCRILAVDNSSAMLERFAQSLENDTRATPVQIICADLQDVTVADASVVVLNFTLQFVPLELRDAVVAGIYRGLRPRRHHGAVGKGHL